MWRETDVVGILMSPLVVYMGVALLVTGALTWVLVRLRAYRWVWNPPLAQAALYLCVLGLLVAWL